MNTDNKNRGFCSACGAPLTGTAFCGHCGAKVVVTAVHTPVPETTPEVIPTAVAAPVAETVPEQTPATRKFPLAAVIFMGISTLWFLVQLCIGKVVTWQSIIYVCCSAAILVGMIVCKKKRNLIVGLGFVVYTCAHLIAIIATMINQLRFGLDGFNIVMTTVTGIVYPLCYAAFGISYLVAKPKIAILKNIMGALLLGLGVLGAVAMGIALIATGNVMVAQLSFFNFLFYLIPLSLSVILYTPYKK